MFSFLNIDLLSVGITIAAGLILGFIVFFKNNKSATSIFFLLFVIANAGWSIFNYLNYKVTEYNLVLWFIRLVMFFAMLQAYSFFLLMLSFPGRKLPLPKKYRIIITLSVILSSLLTLTDFVFSGLSTEMTGRVATPLPGPGVAIFGIMAISLVIAGIITLIKKTYLSSKEERPQFIYLLIGVSMMFSLIIIFNFVFPIAFDSTRFIPLSAVFTLPFIIFTTYATLKHHLLGIKVITTEVITFVLAVVSLIEVIIAEDVSVIILRSGVFFLVLSFGILLIRSVRKEVQQREELEKLTIKLEAANVQLEKLSEQKSQFLSFASHDLKSPINIIKQFASLIADGTYKEPAKIQETIVKIKRTAERATHLVDDFLDIRKIEEGHMDYTFEVRDIIPFVKGITEDYAPLAKAEKNIDISFSSQTASANVKMDTTRLRQVIQNLLSNSIKYTETGSITVTLTEEQKTILISVTDTGLGMDPALLPILFEQFRRDPKVAKKIQGTGLGLYIAKQIVRAHGGEIWADSKGKGLGSSFFVRLPKAAA